MSNESIQLFYKDGSSDKVYCASLEEENGGWMVKFQYGKRGSTLKPGAKTASPVDYPKAKKEYDKLVAEKVGKGYRPENRVRLSYSDGTKDKVYLISMTEDAGKWHVDFQFGYKDSTLDSGRKTNDALPYAEAKQCFDDLVTNKITKGYTIDGGSVSAIQDVGTEKVHSGMTPQLLNPVSKLEGNNLISDNSFIAQEKFDGERRMMRKNDDKTVEGTNRKGFIVPMQMEAATNLADLKCKSCTLDGEDMGDHGIVVFDVLEIDGEKLSSLGTLARWKRLYELVSGEKPKEVNGMYAGCNNGKLYVCATAVSKEAKQKLLDKLKADAKEGIVFKDKSSDYVPGRPASGGNQLKWKFVESATCMVGNPHDTKRSASLLMLNDKGVWIDVGNVTIPVNKTIPKSQDIIEVEYLYAYEGGSLYQPVFKMPRPDQGPEACVTSQLKYKADVDLDDNLSPHM